MSDFDEYAAYDLSEFTEDDFARIDAAIAFGSSDITEPKGGPAIPIELEQPVTVLPSTSAIPDSTEKAKQRQVELSPFRRYRRNKTLYVTDLVSPAWCEVQFDYGLRQKRSRKLEHRPDSFLSGEGKEIFVEKAVAARNDLTINRGKLVHKELEREIMPEQVHVDITSDEERWALRLVNMLSCLGYLMTLGCTREMPIFGMVHDQVVVGIIDEVLRKSVPQATFSVGAKRASESPLTTPKSKKTRRTPSPSQPQITEFFLASPESDPSILPGLSADVPAPEEQSSTSTPFLYPLYETPSHQYTLHLIDTKTRRTNSLPSHDDTLSSRLQLMLYHRLLNNLISTSPPFDFSKFWARLELDPFELFSTRFLLQAGLILDCGDFPMITCLDDLAQAWKNTIQQLDVQGVDTKLQLIYRLQPRTLNSKQRRKRQIRATDTLIDVMADQNDDDLTRAVEASVDDIWASVASDEELAKVLAESLKESRVRSHNMDVVGALRDLEMPPLPQSGENEFADKLADDPELFWALQQSLLTHTKQDGVVDVPEDPASGSLLKGPIPANETSDNLKEDNSSKIETREFTVDESAPDPASGPPLKDPIPTNEAAVDLKDDNSSKIIGTKEFTVDETFLDTYLVDILQWWHGDRKPRGVPLEQSRRCFSCEYSIGCEWRAQKALEAEDKLRQR